jgi:outer membrane protein assembly factor BamE (lipoprotein component of BamABCDE complex)
MKRIKKIFLRTLAALVVLVLGIIATDFAVKTARNYDHFKKAVSALHGMKPGESREQILYAMGKPDFVRKDDDSERNRTSDLPTGTNINDYLVWEWLPKGDHPNNLSVDFDASSSSVLMVTCYENQYMPACQTIADISSVLMNGSEDYIERRLGPPADTKLSRQNDGTETKRLVYDSLGLYFTMKARHITAIHKVTANPDFLWWFRRSQSW